MSYHPRIESKDKASLATIRSRNSALWLINNKRLEEAILGYLAKFTHRYSAELYAFAIEGNHLHSAANYPLGNRSHFQRDFNSCTARAVARHVPNYPGGSLWDRRYSNEFIPEPSDIEEYFFYIVLQPIKDGLVDRISEYPGYNCFHDAVNGIRRKFKVVNWAAYNERARWRKHVNIKDFIEVVELSYKRIPGYEALSQAEYKKLMLKKLEERRVQLIKERAKPSVGTHALLSQKPGSLPKNSKTSTRLSHRPRILCSDPERRAFHKAWYFSVYFAFKEASLAFRAGDLNAIFPDGTYRPPLFTCVREREGP